VSDRKKVIRGHEGGMGRSRARPRKKIAVQKYKKEASGGLFRVSPSRDEKKKEECGRYRGKKGANGEDSKHH